MIRSLLYARQTSHMFQESGFIQFETIICSVKTICLGFFDIHNEAHIHTHMVQNSVLIKYNNTLHTTICVRDITFSETLFFNILSQCGFMKNILVNMAFLRSSRIMECTCTLFTFENGVLLMR